MNLCADTSGSVQIRASQSDLSIANSSPRLESNATTSTGGDVPLRRDLSADLLCPICDRLFDRPVMVTCGHSYCEPCIERHTRNNRNCVICHRDVGPLEAMIPSITLDNMVRKMKNAENIETSSYDDFFVCEERTKQESPKCVRTMSQRSNSKRRLFFSIAGPQICSSPMTPHRRRPLSPSVRPLKSSLKIPPESLNFSPSSSDNPSPLIISPSKSLDLSGEEKLIRGNVFRRNGFGRRSERFTSATQASGTFDENDMFNETPKSLKMDETDGKIKRNSLFRRSLNAIRSRASTRRSSFTVKLISSDIIPEEGDDGVQLLGGKKKITENDDEPNTVFNTTSSKSKNMKSLWRRLFMSKKESKKADSSAQSVQPFHHQLPEQATTIAFIRLEDQHDDPPSDMLKIGNQTNLVLGYYIGIGKKFERVASGNEITLVVFGHQQAGKTTFVRAIRQLFLDCSDDQIRVIPVAHRYKLAGIAVMPYPEGDNRHPHIVSLIVSQSAKVEYVLDIIDPEYDNSNLPKAYMDSCDAAICLIDARNCASLLSAHQIQRNLKTTERSHVQCDMLMNVPSVQSGQARVLSAQTYDATVKKAPVRELCATQLDKNAVVEMLTSICCRVMGLRQLRQTVNSPVL